MGGRPWSVAACAAAACAASLGMPPVATAASFPAPSTATASAAVPAGATASAAVPAGALDPAFAAAGRLAVPLAPGVRAPGESVDALLPGPGGRFRTVASGPLAPGRAGGPARLAVAVRGWLADGRADPGYAARVLAVAPAGPAGPVALADAEADAAGRVYLLTTSGEDWQRRVRLVRSAADGAADREYAPLVDRLPAGLPDSQPTTQADDDTVGLAVLPDGRARVCLPAQERTYVLALAADGSVDASFGTGEAPGWAVLPAGSHPSCRTLAADAAGRTYLAAPGAPGTVVALGPRGAPVPGWGTAAGAALLLVPGSALYPLVLAPTAGGAVYVGGLVEIGNDPARTRPFLARVLPGGRADPGFGTLGVRTYARPGEVVERIGLGAAGRVYAGLAARPGGAARASLLRVLGATGQVDPAFAGGTVRYAARTAAPVPLAAGAARVLVGVTFPRTAALAGALVEARRA